MEVRDYFGTHEQRRKLILKQFYEFEKMPLRIHQLFSLLSCRRQIVLQTAELVCLNMLSKNNKTIVADAMARVQEH